jgi:hypothetical protein
MKLYRDNSGFVLISTLLMLSVFLALFGAYFLTTSIDTASTRYSKDTVTGFYGAEAGLNIRAENIRSIFVGFNRPTGTSPTTSPTPCTASNNGSGDYVCQTMSLNNREVKTHVAEDPANPILLTIPKGERYQDLSAQEYRYTAKSVARDDAGETEAQLELRFKTRLVPLFQFAAFYNKDLEILPGPTMTLSGPVHTNGNLYLYSNSATLSINGQVTAAGEIYRGSKDGRAPTCNNNPVRIMDPLVYRNLVAACPTRTIVTDAMLPTFNGMVQRKVQVLVVPGVEVFDPTPGAVYWDHADLRLALVMTAGDAPSTIQVRNVDDTNNAAKSATLNACAGTIGGKAVNISSFWSIREAKSLSILDVDLLNLLNCLRNNSSIIDGKALNDNTDGGLVFHLTVKGPNSAAAANKYAARLRNAQRIYSSVGGSPAVRGLTVVTDQAAFVMGNYNSTNQIPAAIMADSLNVLSGAWNDASCTAAVTCPIASRVASSTTIFSAFLAGTDSTGGIEGAAGHGTAYANYNGGLENYPRFTENWGGRTLTYRGSFVSLGRPRHVNGSWGNQSYGAPNRDWNYDVSFNNAANLPPITPRFVYLKQELFVRDFDQ